MAKLTNPRYLAVTALTTLEEEEDFIAEILDSFLREAHFSSLDRALFTELFYGTVRMKMNLDYVLGLFSKRPLDKIKPNIKHAENRGLSNTLFGPYSRIR